MMVPRTKSILCCTVAFVSAALTISPAFQPETREKAVLWHNPGRVENLDLEFGPGGRSRVPHPPFTFVEEDHGGTNPKIKVTDARGTKWAVKFGEEVRAENFASRLAWAAGYFVETNYYVPSGIAIGAHNLKRAKGWVDKDGHFADARFQLRSKEPEFLQDMDWSWSQNPFIGSVELNGLKIMMMLTSNWDNKDSRDRTGAGSNNFVFREHENGSVRLLYEVTDWGGSMGKWGNVMSRSKWDCKGYTAQTPHFVEGIKNGVVRWAYHGQHTEDETRGIPVNDVKWLLRYLGRITDRQLRAGLEGSGAAPREEGCFAGAVRERIDELKGL
ncbi:MAG: hypothetical protein M3Z23_19280 [Acidobacteriota bacterium]|nr:hypothetical protein [Acidobacteriota bacterium]